jgi:4'-phosphopantetheinyl transferase
LDAPVSRPTVERILTSEAHVWLTDAGERAARRPDWLDAEERARWLRFLRGVDRDLFLVAHTHLRATLSRYADTTPARWRFVRRRGGRPELHIDQPSCALRFNLSHTHDLVACVVTQGADCGVDVEREGRIADRAGIAALAFHDDERAAVARSPGDFLAYWTLKESYVKATGAGIRVPLDEIRFALGGEPSVSFDEGRDTAEGWWFAHSRPTDQHHLAVALRPARAVKVFWA